MEELKGQESSELSKLNQVYLEKKQIVRQMENQVSEHKMPTPVTDRALL